MTDRIKSLNTKAKKYGAAELGISKTQNKKYYVKYNNKIINFGAKEGHTFLDHHDENIRAAWRARHSKILKNGHPAYKDKTSPEFWNWHITW